MTDGQTGGGEFISITWAKAGYADEHEIAMILPMAPHELPETQMMKLSPFWLRINWFLKADYCLKIRKTLNGAYISIVACKISMYGSINSEACLMWNKIQFYTYSFKISFNLFYSASEKKKHCSLKQKNAL